jgi:flagellar capping protein FliD
MKFNEWLTQNKDEEVAALTNSNVELTVSQDDSLIVNQLEQWVIKLNGLLHNVDEEKRGKLLEKVIKDIVKLS